MKGWGGKRKARERGGYSLTLLSLSPPKYPFDSSNQLQQTENKRGTLIRTQITGNKDDIMRS